MTGLDLTTIGQTCSVGDGTHSKIPRQDDGILYLTSRNFKDGRLDLSNVYYISEEDYERHFGGISKVIAKPETDDLLFSIIGTLGEPYLVRSTDRFGLSSSVAIVRPNRSVLDPRFLLYWSRGPIFQNALFGIKGGVAQGYVSLEMLRSLPAPRLPLPVQRRIAGILSAYDELFENSQRRVAILGAMAGALYREWFVHFRFPGHENQPRVASSLGDIPRGWEVKPLFDLAKVAYGKNLPKKNLVEAGQYPVYGAAKIIGRHTEFNREHRTIICGCRGSVGEMQITQPRCFVTNNSFTFDPTHPDNYFWIFHALKERGLRDVVGGAAQPQITLEGISSVELATPPLGLRSKFNQAVSAMFEQAWTLDAQARNLRLTRDLLLPRVLLGQVEVGTA